ncbi:MAG: hypothetical protein NVS1B6_06010 [Steroidobacteraceae bacterium]
MITPHKKSAPFTLANIALELDVDELGDPIDGQEHVELALRQAQLGTVDVHVADLGRSELSVSDQ